VIPLPPLLKSAPRGIVEMLRFLGMPKEASEIEKATVKDLRAKLVGLVYATKAAQTQHMFALASAVGLTIAAIDADDGSGPGRQAALVLLAAAGEATARPAAVRNALKRSGWTTRIK